MYLINLFTSKSVSHNQHYKLLFPDPTSPKRQILIAYCLLLESPVLEEKTLADLWALDRVLQVVCGPGGVACGPGGVAWVERNLTCARIYHFTSPAARSAITRQR